MFYDVVGASPLSSATLPVVTPANAAPLISRTRPVSVAPTTQTLPASTPIGGFHAIGTIDAVTGRGLNGAGFISTRLGVGRYRIQFRVVTNPGEYTILFGSRASVTGTTPYVSYLTPTYLDIETKDRALNLRDATFDFAMVRS